MRYLAGSGALAVRNTLVAYGSGDAILFTVIVMG